jgi:2-dehydro-3-deoxygluconokinase
MSAVLVATSAYSAGMVRQLGQTHFIDMIAGAGAAGIEIRRELFTSDLPDLVRMGERIAARGLVSVYSAPIELWQEDGALAHDVLHEAMLEADRLGARYLKVSLGHYASDAHLRALATYLEMAPVPLLVENDQTRHGGQIDSMRRFLADSAGVGIPVGMTFDIGNWHWAGADPFAAAELLAPYVRYVHCKAVSKEGGRLIAVPVSEADPDWRRLFSYFAPGVQRAIEFPLAGTDLEAVTRRYIDLLEAA